MIVLSYKVNKVNLSDETPVELRHKTIWRIAFQKKAYSTYKGSEVESFKVNNIVAGQGMRIKFRGKQGHIIWGLISQKKKFK